IRTASSPGEVGRFLIDIKGKTAGRSLERARHGSEPLTERIQRLLKVDGDGPAWWSILDVHEKATRPLGLGLGELRAAELWPVVQVYLDTLCEMLRRRAQRALRAARSGEARG